MKENCSVCYHGAKELRGPMSNYLVKDAELSVEELDQSAQTKQCSEACSKKYSKCLRCEELTNVCQPQTCFHVQTNRHQLSAISG